MYVTETIGKYMLFAAFVSLKKGERVKELNTKEE